MPALTTLQGATGYGDSHVNATSGGKVDLSAVTTDAGNRVQFYADGTGSTIDLSGLTAMTDTVAYNDSIEARNGASILIPLITSLDRVDLTIRDTASVTTSQIASCKQATLYVSGGAAPDFSSLATLDFTSGGTLQADGAGSVLALPALTTLQVRTGYGDSYVNATNSGKVDLMPSRPTRGIASSSMPTGRGVRLTSPG